MWFTHRNDFTPAAFAFSPAALPATNSGCPTCMIAPSFALCSSVPELIVTSGICFSVTLPIELLSTSKSAIETITPS